MAQSGYIYVLYNPSANGVVKIGKTQRNPDERAKELSSATGVPTPFVVIYQSIFQDCVGAELFIHTKLDKYRVANNREFFQLPIYLAVDTVLEAKRLLDKLMNMFSEFVDDSTDSDSNNSTDDKFLDSLTLDDEQNPGREMLEAADQYYYGLGDTIEDYSEAFNLYQKAARLGSAEAFLQMGCMCRDGEGRSADNKLAIEFFKEGIKHGNDECWGEMARIYSSEGHSSNEEKCWSKYFSSENYGNFSFRRRYCVYYFVRNSILENRPIAHKEQIIQIRSELLEYFNGLAEAIRKRNGNIDLVRKCFNAVKDLS
jgi:hypothetical protein